MQANSPSSWLLGAWTHCSNGRKSLPKFQRHARLWDVSIQMEEMVRRKKVKRSAKQVKSPVSCGCSPEYHQAFLSVCIFWNQPSKGRNCNSQQYVRLSTPIVHITVLTFAGKRKFPAFSTRVYTCTCNCCPRQSYGFSSWQSTHTKQVLAANPNKTYTWSLIHHQEFVPLIVSNKHKRTKKHFLLLDAVGKTENARGALS